MKDDRRADAAVLILRLGVGAIALYYGAEKLLGVFGGPGVKGTIQGMEKGMGIPPVLTVLAICGEFFGGLGMIFGFLTSLAAFGFACVMAVATYENWKTPGLLNAVFTTPSPEQPAKVFYTVALFAGAVAIMFLGGGAYSIDNRLFNRKKKGVR